MGEGEGGGEYKIKNVLVFKCVGLEDKAPRNSWMFNFGGFTDSPHPHKQETRGLDTIQATSFYPWWLLRFFQEHFETKGDL